MKKEEFEKQYCINSDVTPEFYEAHFVTLPCNCGEDDCPKWACVCNNKISIKVHKDLYE